VNETGEIDEALVEATGRRRRGGIGGREEFSATGMLQSDGTLVGDLTSATSGELTWKAVRTVAR
jgi:hypothetical protein